MRAWWRQRRHPVEFRIARPVGDARLLAEARDLARRLAEAANAAAPPPATEGPAAPAAGEAPDLAFLADLATALFRLKKTLVDPATGRPDDATRRTFRHLETAWDVLRAAGFDVREHRDEPIPDGHVGLRIAAYEPAPGLTRNRVIETLKPSVWHGDRLLQMGEVIVGTPADAAPPTASPETS